MRFLIPNKLAIEAKADEIIALSGPVWGSVLVSVVALAVAFPVLSVNASDLVLVLVELVSALATALPAEADVEVLVWLFPLEAEVADAAAANAFSPTVAELALDTLEEAGFEFELAEPEPEAEAELPLPLPAGLVTATAVEPVELELDELFPPVGVLLMADPLLPEADDALPVLEAAALPFNEATTTAVVPVDELEDELFPPVGVVLMPDPLLALAPDVVAAAPLPTTTLDDPDELELEDEDAKTGIAKNPAITIDPKIIFVFFIYFLLV